MGRDRDGFSARGDNNEVSVFRKVCTRGADQREPTRGLLYRPSQFQGPFRTPSADFHFPDGCLLIPRPSFLDEGNAPLCASGDNKQSRFLDRRTSWRERTRCFDLLYRSLASG